jgi:hypothetical protein
MVAWLYGWRWPLWSVFTLLWTIALLTPIPSTLPTSFLDQDFDLRYWVSKSAHIGVFVFWAAFTGWLRAPGRYRFVLMFFLMGHATITEVLQYATELGRTGALMDVAFDNLGIGLGMFASWNWWISE